MVNAVDTLFVLLSAGLVMLMTPGLAFFYGGMVRRKNVLIEEAIMKLIIAIIQPHCLDMVKEELYNANVNLLSVNEILGHGRQKGVAEVYRGSKESGNLLRKIRLEIAVNDSFVDLTVKAILKGAKSGQVGDGKIFILPMEQCVRIRTEEEGPAAIG